MTFDLLDVLGRDARGLSDVNLARFLLAENALTRRLRFDPSASAWEAFAGGSWRRVDRRQAVWLLAGAADEVCTRVRARLEAEGIDPDDDRLARLGRTLNALQSERRLVRVLSLLSGADEARAPVTPSVCSPRGPSSSASSTAAAEEAARTFLSSLSASEDAWTLTTVLFAAYTASTDAPRLSRTRFYEVAREVLGPERKRRGRYGWPVEVPS
jgi:hypothetical protein